MQEKMILQRISTIVGEIEFGGLWVRQLSPGIILNSLSGNEDVSRLFAGLPENVDRDAAAGIPIAADAQPVGFDLGDYTFGYVDCAGFVEITMVAEGV